MHKKEWEGSAKKNNKRNLNKKELTANEIGEVTKSVKIHSPDFEEILAMETTQANLKEERKRKAEPGYLQLGQCPYQDNIPGNFLGPVLNERFKRREPI